VVKSGLGFAFTMLDIEQDIPASFAWSATLFVVGLSVLWRNHVAVQSIQIVWKCTRDTQLKKIHIHPYQEHMKGMLTVLAIPLHCRVSFQDADRCTNLFFFV
jgi:protein gp37